MARRTAALAAQTREALLDSALVVFAERGFAAAQLEDIARRAEVTRGALYHHFTGKADLFQATLDERWGSVLGPALDELTPSPPPVSPFPSVLAGPDDPDLRARQEEQQRRQLRGRLRSFVSTVLHLVEVDPRARALLRMSLSGDHARAAASNDSPGGGGPGVTERERSGSAAGASPASSWADWESHLVTLLAELEPASGPPSTQTIAGLPGVAGEGDSQRPRAAVEDRAHALVAGLLGHAVWVTLRGPGESSVVALAEVLCESALPS
jgi:AcrR family transcriptional regulator